MSGRSFAYVLGVGVWTAVTLGGGIFMIFNNPLLDAITEQPNLHIPIYTQVLLVLLILLIIFMIAAIGGGLWGGGLARLMGQEMRPLVKTGAWYWGSTVLITGLVLYFSQIPGAALDRAIYFSTYDTHYFFTLVFAPAVGIAAMVNTRHMAGKLGFSSLKRVVGRNSGWAAAVAFLLVSMVLLYGYGWEVGGPFAGRRYSMILIMHYCNFGAALAGGLMMGWTLVKERVAVIHL
jgi:hypothetical protein